MTFHWVDTRYPLNTDIATGTAKTPGGPRAFLTQADKWVISSKSPMHQNSYSRMKKMIPFLLEADPAVLGMGILNEYL